MTGDVNNMPDKLSASVRELVFTASQQSRFKVLTIYHYYSLPTGSAPSTGVCVQSSRVDKAQGLHLVDDSG